MYFFRKYDKFALEETIRLYLKDVSAHHREQHRESFTIEIYGENENLYPLVSSIYLEKSTSDPWDLNFESHEPEFYFFKPCNREAAVESFEVSSIDLVFYYISNIPVFL